MKSIVIAEDDDLLRAYFEGLLTDNGYTCRSFSRCAKALEYVAGSGESPDLIFSDINMPGMTGLEFLRATRDAGCRVPFILVSGGYELPSALEAVRQGASDYLLKPATPEEILGLVAKNIFPGFGRKPQGINGAGADNSAGIRHLASHPAGPHLLGLLNSLCDRRIETLQHSRRVAAYAGLVGRRFTDPACGEQEIADLELGALLHDIGKVGVPENVIGKPGPLTAEEWRVIRMHPVIGYELLKAIPGLAGVAEIVHAHHEFFDGTGYPLGRAGESIPLGARIFSVVDTFDAITSDRPYRQAMSAAVGRAEIKRLSGSQFDPQVVGHFLSIPETELEGIRRQRDDCRQQPRVRPSDAY